MNHYNVRISFQGDYSWKANKTLGVVCSDVQEAIDTVKHKYRNEKELFIWSISHQGRIDYIVNDGEIINSEE